MRSSSPLHFSSMCSSPRWASGIPQATCALLLGLGPVAVVVLSLLAAFERILHMVDPVVRSDDGALDPARLLGLMVRLAETPVQDVFDASLAVPLHGKLMGCRRCRTKASGCSSAVFVN